MGAIQRLGQVPSRRLQHDSQLGGSPLTGPPADTMGATALACLIKSGRPQWGHEGVSEARTSSSHDFRQFSQT